MNRLFLILSVLNSVIGIIMTKSFLKGKRKTIRLNGHYVKVIVPDKSMSSEEAKEKLVSMLESIRK